VPHLKNWQNPLFKCGYTKPNIFFRAYNQQNNEEDNFMPTKATKALKLTY